MPEARATTSVNTLSQILDGLPEWANEFYKAKKAEGISTHTQAFYKQQLGHFLTYCDAQAIDRISQITAGNIREYLLWLEEGKHNPGGRHAAYRVLKTFLRWYDCEVEPDGWRNPISKVKAPKISEDPLDPVDLATVKAMAATCDNSFLGRRDKAVLLFLLDTGVRAQEFEDLDLKDIDLVTGLVTIRQGKGKKARSVVVGSDARKALRNYLKMRKDELTAVWINNDQDDRFHYGGLRKMILKHAELAKVKPPGAHDFRRAFAINMLRKGVDLATLAELMGHTSIKVLRRYLKYLPDDLQEAHRKGSPVDHGGFRS